MNSTATLRGSAEDNSIIEKLIWLFLMMFFLASSFSIAISEIGYYSALGLWMIQMAMRKKFAFPGLPITGVLLAYVCIEIVTTIFSTNIMQSLLYMERRLLLLPLMYLLVQKTPTRKTFGIFYAALIISSVGVSLWSMKDIIINLSEYLHFQRRLAEFQMYMTTGGLLMIIILMLLPVLVHQRTPKKYRLWAVTALIPLFISLFFTFTRSSWLGFIGGAILIGVIRSKKIVVILSGVLVIIVMIASPQIRDRIFSIVDPYHPNNISRVHMWETGVRMARDYPVLGIGDVGTEVLWPKYAEPDWPPEGHLHNNEVMWLVTLGGVGLIIMITLFARIWIVIQRIARRLSDDWLFGSFALGALAVQVGFHINGLFEWNFGDAEVITLVWAITGLAMAASRIAEQEHLTV